MSTLLVNFTQDVVSAGLVGEQTNAEIVFLTALSAALPSPLNLTVCGPSAAGKNHLIETVARFLPEDRKRFMTGMTPKAMMHMGEKDLQHKAVFIAEYEGVTGADYPIRTFQSEGRIQWEYVDKTEKNGLETKRKTILGPAAFIQATTRVSLHPENETRLLFIHIDESREQTKAVNRRQAQSAAGKVSEPPQSLFEGWGRRIAALTETRVIIPFAEQLADAMPADLIRSRRDFPKLLGLIKVSAYLHQESRARDGQGQIVARVEDYNIAKRLFEHCYASKVEHSLSEFFKCVEDEVDGFRFSTPDIMQRTGWRKSKTYEVLGRLEELGSVGPGDKYGSYTLLRRVTGEPVALPQKIRLTAEDFRLSTQISTVSQP
jgi:hypothetical protein